MAEALPPRPHLGWLKNAAKERLASLRASRPDAKLADAQLDVARRYGFASWRALKARIDSLAPPTDEARRNELLTAFRGAIGRGDVQVVRALLDEEPVIAAAINEPIFAFGGRPIGAASRHHDLVDLLIEYGADINLKSDWWAGPWGILDNAEPADAEFLISRGATVDVFAAAHLNKLDRLRELLDADPQLVHAKGGDGCRPLHYARSEAAIDLILSCGAEIDARDVDHEATAAQWMLPNPPGGRYGLPWQRCMELIRHLVSRGATPDVFIACARDDVARLKSIIDSDPTALDAVVGQPGYAPCPVAPGRFIYVYVLGDGATPFDVAATHGSKACMELLNERATPKQRLLGALREVMH
ncbi:MAG: hypothetical protein QM770_11835 [Tepidisphaeraceae bacterium]